MQSYIYWALLGMVGYSLTTLFTKLAERSGEVSSYMVLAVSSIIVPIFVIAIVGFRGELKPLIYDLEKGTLAWAIAGGLALTVAVTSRQCGSADLWHVHRRGIAAWRVVPRRANDLAQDRWARRRRYRRGAYLDLAKHGVVKRKLSVFSALFLRGRIRCSGARSP